MGMRHGVWWLALLVALTGVIGACGMGHADHENSEDGDTTAVDGDQTPDGDDHDGDKSDSLDGDGSETPDGDGSEAAEGESADGEGVETDGSEATDGDVTSEDGDSDSTSETPTTTHCRDLTPGATPCVATAGSGATLLQGTILTPQGILEGGDLLIAANGTIACVGCDCSASDGYQEATVVTCAQGVISPGLINAHDHITYTQNSPGSWGTERFEHRHDWREGINGHHQIKVPGSASADQVAWGELRQLITGTTSMAGSGGIKGLVRNLDTAGMFSDLPISGAINNDTFPLDDSSGKQLASTCAYPTIPTTSVLNSVCYLPHVAEGINAYARNEFLCLSGGESGAANVTASNSTFVHMVGTLAVDGETVASHGTSIVWSPRSNISLYGNTAPVSMYKRQGVTLALGTDWTASGSMNLLRELACADSYNQTYLNHFFTDRDLWRMTTEGAAEALHIDNVVGKLKTGLTADIAVFKTIADVSAYRSVIQSSAADTLLVLRGGKPMYGDSNVMAALPGAQTQCDQMGDVCGSSKIVCVQAELSKSFTDLSNANASIYALKFCGTPTNEPTCVPSRPGEYTGIPTATDRDGDGVPDAEDNCPDVFNPIRPLDGGKQADADSDGVGDACDPCPTAPNTENCPGVDPNDRDGDGIPNDQDNCPDVANSDQADRDSDGHGDACDACPDTPNPGANPCPFSIYAVKQGTVTAGTSVLVEGIVTGITTTTPKRFFIQVPQAEQDATLKARFSGLYIYTATGQTAPALGDRVKVAGTIKNFYNTLEISPVTTITVVSSGNALPDPVVVTPAAVLTGGTDAAAYEAVLVHTEGNVTAVTTDAVGGDTTPTNEFLLDGLRVNDYLYLTSPFPTLGDRLSVTGILRYANNNSKLEPRSAADVVTLTSTPPTLTAFGPATAYIGVGDANMTTIPVMTVTLNKAPTVDTVVTITSGDTSKLQAFNATVHAGSTTANVLFTGVAATTTPVTVSATLGSTTLTAAVTVTDTASVAFPVSATPNPIAVNVGGTATVTVVMNKRVASDFSVTVDDGSSTLFDAPTSFTVAAGGNTGTFVVSGLAAGSGTITVTTSAGHLDIPVTVSASATGTLMLSEVLFNPASSTDTNLEWVELYNATSADIDLSGYSLGYAGTSYAYGKFQLAGTLPAHGCIVVGGPTSSADNYSPTFSTDNARDFNPDLANAGDHAAALGIFHMASTAITATSVPIDAVIYGTTNDRNLADENGSTAVDVGAGAPGNSISRTGSGWQILTTPTPGQCAL